MTTRALVVIFVPREASGALCASALELTATRAAQFAAAREVGRLVV